MEGSGHPTPGLQETVLPCTALNWKWLRGELLCTVQEHHSNIYFAGVEDFILKQKQKAQRKLA